MTVLALPVKIVNMKERQLRAVIEDLCFSDHKMAFVSGPRQCGKTTLARMMLRARGNGTYHNWDDIDFRRLWAKQPKASVPSHRAPECPLVVFDEIHKAKLWKRTLKGIYDTLDSPADIVVTGSARLNVYRKGSDSLLGRYYHFRLHPFSLREMEGATCLPADTVLDALFGRSHRMKKARNVSFEALMTFGPFPEPLLAQNVRKTRLWRRSRTEKVIREDLRDLSRSLELSQIEMLAALLPERVASPLSLSSLCADLEVSHGAIKRWLNYLEELYYVFQIKPYTRRVTRSLRKAGKFYLWDPAEIADPGVRFENLVACHLLKACHFWTDSGEGTFGLHYLRNKEKQEIDFLVTRDGAPWLPVEAKLRDTSPSANWKKFMRDLPCRQGLQLCAEPNHWRVFDRDGVSILVASASEALFYFV